MFVFNFTLGYQIWTNCLQNISNYLRSCCRTLNIILLPGPTHNVTIIKISFRKEKKSFSSQRPLNTWGLNFSSTERITKKNLSLEIKKMYFWKVFFFFREIQLTFNQSRSMFWRANFSQLSA